MASQPIPHYTAEEYLRIDRDSDFSSEYIHGEIVPVLAGTPWHNLIIGNTSRALGNRLPANGCRLFSPLRVCLDRNELYCYPDVAVVCGQLEFTDNKKDTVTNPKIMVEVLSPTTMNYDLGRKLRWYWGIPPLTDIIFIDQEKVWIEHWFRSPSEEWAKRVLEDPQHMLHIASPSCEIPVADLYAGVEFPA